MSPSLPALTRFQQTFSICEKYVDPAVPILPKPRAESTEHAWPGPRAADVAASIEWQL
jgi:hypothetical protein